MDINDSVLGKLRLLFGHERLHLLLQLGSTVSFVLSSICFERAAPFLQEVSKSDL